MTRKTISKKKGQAVIESVLIMTALISLSVFTFKTIQGEGGGDSWMNTLVGAPSKYLSGMAQTGKWVKAEPNVDIINQGQHPKNRTIQIKGVDAK